MLNEQIKTAQTSCGFYLHLSFWSYLTQFSNYFINNPLN